MGPLLLHTIPNTLRLSACLHPTTRFAPNPMAPLLMSSNSCGLSIVCTRSANYYMHVPPRWIRALRKDVESSFHVDLLRMKIYCQNLPDELRNTSENSVLFSSTMYLSGSHLQINCKIDTQQNHVRRLFSKITNPYVVCSGPFER